MLNAVVGLADPLVAYDRGEAGAVMHDAYIILLRCKFISIAGACYLDSSTIGCDGVPTKSS